MKPSSLSPYYLVAIATILVGTLLNFWLQPLFTKQILPILGGAPAVWNTALVSFQTMLLLGYTYADRLTHLRSLRHQIIIHSIIILAILTWNFLTPSGFSSTESAYATPFEWLLKNLFLHVGPALFLLATTSSLIQHWVAQKEGTAPYRLYAVSNAGSLLGIAGFLLFWEPFFGLSQQKQFWNIGFTIYALLLLTFMWKWLHPTGTTSTQEPRPRIDGKTRLKWLALSAIPSALLVAHTTHITTDIAPVPMLWLLPLAIYLGTYIAAFLNWPPFADKWLLKIVPWILIPLLIDFYTGIAASGGLAVLLWHMAAFSILSLACHRHLYLLRPPAAGLTGFYLTLALGGVIGSAVVSLIAPFTLNRLLEYPLLLAAGIMLLPTTHSKEQWPLYRQLAFFLAVTAAMVLFHWLIQPLLTPLKAAGVGVLMAAGILLIKLCFEQTRHPLILGGLYAIIALAGAYISDQRSQAQLHERNFYGALTVTRPTPDITTLRHGTTMHGAQYRSAEQSNLSLTYYHPEGPLGEIAAWLTQAPEPLRIGAVGLGAGSLACLFRSQDQVRFYEINPLVKDIAYNPDYFSYLNGCPPKSDVQLGDARLTMRTQTQAPYDIIVLDAFTSDAVPVHLLTKEAFAIYAQNLAPDGIMAAHVSSRYLDLAPVVAKLAETQGWAIRQRIDGKGTAEPMKMASNWLIIGPEARVEAFISHQPPKRWQTVPTIGAPLWTDDFSNLIGVFTFYGF